jgi:hypothetical protein
METDAVNKYPIAVMLACIIWLLYGAGLVFGSILMMMLGDGGGGEGASLIIGLILGLVGLFFLYTGVRVLRSKANGNLRNGVGGIIVGLLLSGSNLDSGINMLMGLGLIVSGILFVTYNNQYKHFVSKKIS